MNNEGIMVPLIFFSALVLLVMLLLAYQLIKKRTFIRLLEKNSDMSPASIEAVGRYLFAPKNDQRKGVFMLVVAFAIWGFSWTAEFRGGNLDLNDALNGIALFPFFAGVAYLILHYLDRD
ncbi:hypothetical protein [Pseudidiomarina insulisalsae]|uniref:DUF6249 domain-containing protein n=1 Tax=Pseudidiomarina insulisalsae TaxID=575789 RepID=A0A432YF28_9GAMM|nr:hypothetical protein [Pseudidiomarina insulisalsae]RUO59549.1 hypothetical protein CWI71_09025 [Pseudidiomarina insulisalsae]